MHSIVSSCVREWDDFVWNSTHDSNYIYTHIPNLQLYTLAIDYDCSDFEVDSYGRNVASTECVV